MKHIQRAYCVWQPHPQVWKWLRILLQVSGPNIVQCMYIWKWAFISCWTEKFHHWHQLKKASCRRFESALSTKLRKMISSVKAEKGALKALDHVFPVNLMLPQVHHCHLISQRIFLCFGCPSHRTTWNVCLLQIFCWNYRASCSACWSSTRACTHSWSSSVHFPEETFDVILLT